jgi:hypothetical protein
VWDDTKLSDALMVVIERAQEQRDRLVSGPANQNARKDWRSNFWINLLAVWRAVTELPPHKGAKSPSRQLKINFLVTCSEPVFPVKEKVKKAGREFLRPP